MKIQEKFGKFISGFIGFLLWFIPLVGIVVGVILFPYNLSYVFSGRVDGADLFLFLLFIGMGLLGGIIANVILLGPLVVLINIMNYLEEIRNNLPNSLTKNEKANKPILEENA
jgi:hypothetical protein